MVLCTGHHSTHCRWKVFNGDVVTVSLFSYFKKLLLFVLTTRPYCRGGLNQHSFDLQWPGIPLWTYIPLWEEGHCNPMLSAYQTADQEVWVSVLCSWASHFTPTTPLSTQVYKLVLSKFINIYIFFEFIDIGYKPNNRLAAYSIPYLSNLAPVGLKLLKI